MNHTAAAADAQDYKHTLNLPQTDFAMQANLAKREPEMLARWEAEKLYEQVQAATAGRPVYWFVDGPPYANGDIHIGHAVNKVLKDMVVKAARLDGKQAAFVPGWDCHGLPIELQVEKKFGKVGEKLDAATFRARCREYAEEQIERQRVDFKRLGVLADWYQPYKTMQPAFEAEELRVLARIVENGHLVRGFKPVHWCLDCGSSLAEAEVEYQDKQSAAIDVAFPAESSVGIATLFGVGDDPKQPIRFVIWTTTPWTLPANQAVCVHPDLPYALVEMGEFGRLVLAEGLVEACARRYGVENPRVLATVSGRALERQTALHPFEKIAPNQFVPRSKTLLCGEHVTLEAGTGLVHTAPAHGADDYEIGFRNGLPLESPLLSTGLFAEGTPVVGGLHLRKAEEPILAALRKAGALIHEAKITHSYPHCWRHKTPLVFRATPQWFVSMEANGLRRDALAAIDATQWVPEWGHDRIYGMIKDRPDWCISRQRYWGVPLALFIARKTQAPHPETATLLRQVADRVEREGLEAWFGTTAEDWGVDGAVYEKCRDTLDVWFDSGTVFPSSFVSTGHALPEKADMYLEGSDQHRGWFHSSLLTRVATDGKAPYKRVLTHGFTVDEQGRKMSKSLGNVVAPQTVTKTLGADVLRLWVASADYSGEIAISDNLLKRIADAYRRIRNTARYLLSNLHDFDPAQHSVPMDQLVEIDRWALSQAAALQERLKKAYGEQSFHVVYQELHNYCVNDLGGLYLDILKDRLYTMKADAPARRSAQTALLHIAEALVRWIAPILSFTADEIWRLLPGDRSQSVFAQAWHDIPSTESRLDHADWLKLWELRERAQKQIEEQRNQKKIGSALEAKVVVYADPLWLKLDASVADELRFWFITSQVEVTLDPSGFLPMQIRPSNASNDKTVFAVDVKAIGDEKCARCWHRRPDIGSHARHPALCARCVSNVEGPGEVRRWF